jgi:hypothetical protein
MSAPMAYPVPPPAMQEPAEAQSIKSILKVVRILAIIFGVLALIAGIAFVVLIPFGVLVGGVWLILGGIVALVVYLQMKSIEEKVNARQYEAAKSQTLIWMILGFLFGLLLGIILLIAFLKFDPLINWQRNQMAGGMPPPGYAAPYAPPPAAPAPAPPPVPAPAAAPSAPFCAKCGKPTTWIAQYGRYYCYTDNLYV